MQRFIVPAACLLAWAAAVQGQARDPVVVGEPVRDAIDRFGELNIFSSSRLLPGRAVVRVLPDAAAGPVEQINFLLAPYGLVLEMTDDATGYVARAELPPATDDPAPAVLPPVPAAVPAPLEEIVVRAPYRLERTLRRTTLDWRQLSQIPALGGDALRSLHVLPGVATDGYSARHRIRGGDHNEVLYRLDGVTQFEAFHFSDVQSLFSAVNSNVIESADVYVSGYPVRFGTRMSGVVDQHLVEPERPSHGTVDVNLLAASADLRGYQGNWSWLLSGRVSLIGEFVGSLRSGDGEDIDTPTFDDQIARLAWNDARNEFVLGAIRSDETLDVERESTGERGIGSYRVDDLWLRWSHGFGSGAVMSWQARRFDAARARRGTLEREFDAARAREGTLESEFDAARVGEGTLEGEFDAGGRLSASREFAIASLANEWRWSTGRATDWRAGWTLANHSADYTAAFDAAYGPLARPVQAAASRSRALSVVESGRSRHAYVSASRALGGGVTATAGLRHDDQDIAEVDAGAWSARAALQWRLSERWTADLDVGRYSQQQFLHEVQIDDGLTRLEPPQNADQVNLGVQWDGGGGLRLRADVFARRIPDPWTRFDNLYNRLVLLPELHGDRYRIASDEARIRGAEFAATRTAGDLSWSLSYTISSAEERVGGVWRPRSWDQPHAVKTGLAWNGRAWRIGAFATWRSGWPVTAPVTDPAQLPWSLNGDRLPAYASVDVNVRRVRETARGVFEVYLDITNLTNRNNVSGYLYGEDFTREGARSLPIIPSLGLTWRWR